MSIDGAVVGRALTGIVVGALGITLTFLIMVQGSFHQGITDFDWAHILGTAIHGTAEEQAGGGDALAVVGDTAGPDGLYATAAGALVLMIVHAVAVYPLVKRGWIVQGLVLGALAFVAIGVVYVPFVDARLDTPIGPWGVDQGAWTPVVLGLSCLGSCVVGSRIHSLAMDPRWWRPGHVEVDETLERLTGIDTASLELPEKGPEEPLMRS